MSRTLAAALLVFSAIAAHAQDARQIVEQAQNRANAKSERYEGTLRVEDAKRRISEKRWVYERIGSFGKSKSLLRFTAPPEVKGVALLIVNHPDRASDQWMWTPAIERERRIALQDRSTRFFGTDFSFEDLEERDLDQFDYKLLGSETMDAVDCWKIDSTPKKAKSSQYTHSVLWIRKSNYVAARIEGYAKDKLVRRIDYIDVQQVDGIWTARKVEVYDAGRKSRTIMQLEKLEYNAPMRDSDFTLEALRRLG